jgi:hypothetical protein
MSFHAPQFSVDFPTSVEHFESTPQTFTETVAQAKAFVLQVFDREIAEKCLYYHTRQHVEGVQQRASRIFQVSHPDFNVSDTSARLGLVLDLCAVAHDMVQIFVPQVEPHTSRRRETGASEAATIEDLLAYLSKLNQPTLINQASSAQFTDSELQIIQEAIAATICDYDPVEQAIYQPALYRQEPAISLVARILALADIGSLAMEGIEAYNLEGSLLFLEENPDVQSLLQHDKLKNITLDYPELHENIRQRLLHRARFQVNFAKSRLRRLPQELEVFPSEVAATLLQQVFHYLTPETIEAIEFKTPTAEDTSLQTLVDFFQLDQIAREIGDLSCSNPI